MKKILVIIFVAITFWNCKKENQQYVNKQSNTQETSIGSDETFQDSLVTSHEELMKNVKIEESGVKSVGILVYDGVNSLDVFGPRYVLGQIMGVDMKLIALKPGHVKTVMGIEFVPDAVINDIKKLDVLVIPGGFKGTIEAVYNEEVKQWIRDIDKTSKYTTSVCTGGWILASTGLLKGKKATTNWYDAKNMLNKYGATFTNERFSRDGKYWTAAGVTASMDMSLALLEEIAGRDYAQGVMLDMEYDPAPPFEGGSPEKTSPQVLSFMTMMYKAGVDPIIKDMENKKTHIK